MSTPTFALEPDGSHVIWQHDCLVTWTDEPGDQEIIATTMRIPICLDCGWHVVSKDPLTLTPSLLCTGCGTHGFITDGRWVSV